MHWPVSSVTTERKKLLIPPPTLFMQGGSSRSKAGIHRRPVSKYKLYKGICMTFARNIESFIDHNLSFTTFKSQNISYKSPPSNETLSLPFPYSLHSTDPPKMHDI